MADIDLIIQQLRKNGHTVESGHTIPDNAGRYEFTVDGTALTLEEARRILELDADPNS